MNDWKQISIGEFIDFNPAEKLKKGELAKKIPMGMLVEFQRKIKGFEFVEYQGGPKFRNGDTLFAKITPCLENGKTAQVDILKVGEVAFGSSEFIVLRENNNSTNDYIFYLAKSPIFRYRAISCMEGTSGRKRVNESALKRQVLKVPDKTAQQKISAVLSVLDDKIDLNNKINAELEAMAKTLYDYWFVQFDFPDENRKPYKSSGGKMVYNEALKREIPEGWEAGYASDLIKFNPSLTIVRGNSGSYIDMTSLPISGFMTSGVQKKIYTGGGMKFQNGDVLLARITPCLENGKTALVTLLGKDEVGFGSTEYIVMRGKKQSLPYFTAIVSRSEGFRKYAITNMTGTSGRKRVDAKTLERYPIVIPDNDLLVRFEQAMLSSFEMLTKNTKENCELQDIRDWLLPMLMNGQITVKDVEKEVQINEVLGMVAEPEREYGV